jgi:hypothetical protein
MEIAHFQSRILESRTVGTTQLVLSTRSTTIELRSTTTLFFSVSLTLSRSEKTCSGQHVSRIRKGWGDKNNLSHDERPAKGS